MLTHQDDIRPEFSAPASTAVQPGESLMTLTFPRHVSQGVMAGPNTLSHSPLPLHLGSLTGHGLPLVQELVPGFIVPLLGVV